MSTRTHAAQTHAFTRKHAPQTSHQHHGRVRTVARASSSSASTLTVADALATLTRHASTPGVTLYDVDDDIQLCIDILIEDGSVSGGIENAVRGDGEWQVFCAPHIVNLAGPVGVRFAPLRYVIDSGNIRSDVRHGGIVPDGWLSASGKVSATTPYELDGRERPACRIDFDTFWIGAQSGDKSSPRDDPNASDEANVVDKVINAVGKVGFLEGIATFPVLFYDHDAGVVVFQFPPLKSNIAAFLQR